MAGGTRLGEVRRDPFAMLPFCRLSTSSDYFDHWLEMGAKPQSVGVAAPKIFCVNWFRKNADGKFLWPGYGENMRVLQWVVERVEGRARGQDNVFGITPGYGDLNWSGLEFSPAQFEQVAGIEPTAWKAELALHAELFRQLAHHLPTELSTTRAKIEARLAAG